MTLTVLHLVGSPVSQFYADLSVLYASDCLAATADPEHHQTRIAYVSPDQQWRFPADLSTRAIADAAPVPLPEGLRRLAAMELDVMVPQMFCLPGMTTYRGLFDALGIPYVGNRPLTMALAANKAQAKAVVAAAGVPVPSGELVRAGQRPSLVPPVVVKPVDADNSLGLALIRDVADYPGALDAAHGYSDQVLVESYIPLGREVRCGIVVRDGELQCLPLEEYRMDSSSRPVRLPKDKLDQNAAGELYLVAKDSSRAWIVDPADPVTARVWELARACHNALGCRDYSLFDFRIDPDGQPWFLEAGLYCSFATQSVIAVMAHAAGIEVDALLRTAIDQTVRAAQLSQAA